MRTQTKIVNGIRLVGSTMLVECQHTMLASAVEDDDLSETGKYLMADGVTPGHPLGEIRAALFREARLAPTPPRFAVIPFVLYSGDPCTAITGTFVKRKVSKPAWRVWGPNDINMQFRSELGIYLPTFDDWSLEFVLRVTGENLDTDVALSFLISAGTKGIGLAVDGATTGTFTVDDDHIEVIEEE